MIIWFRVDASSLMGGGHVLRCLTLADALRRRGAEIGFVAAQVTAPLAEHIEVRGYRLAILESVSEAAATGEGWESVPLSRNTQRLDAERFLSAIGPAVPDWVAVDHYRLDLSWEEIVRPCTRGILVLDDLANRPHDCDILLDHTVGRSAADYAGLVGEGCLILKGGGYKLLREEFARARTAAIKRRSQEQRAVERILVSLGFTDIGGASASVLKAVLAANVRAEVDVIVGAGAQSLPHMESLLQHRKNLALHVNSPDIAELMVAADICVGAGGMGSFERCCLGVPSLTLVLAENQQSSAAALAAAGATDLVTGIDQLPTQLAALAADHRRRRDMSRVALDLCDGLGAERVAEIMADPRLRGNAI